MKVSARRSIGWSSLSFFGKKKEAYNRTALINTICGSIEKILEKRDPQISNVFMTGGWRWRGSMAVFNPLWINLWWVRILLETPFLTHQRLTFPFPFVHHQPTDLFLHRRGTTINPGNEISRSFVSWSGLICWFAVGGTLGWSLQKMSFLWSRKKEPKIDRDQRNEAPSYTPVINWDRIHRK